MASKKIKSILKTMEDLIKQPIAEGDKIINFSYEKKINGEVYQCNVRHAGF